MTYYRVKEQYDNFGRNDGSIFVRNELYTEGEMKKFKVPSQYVVKVEEKKSNVYWCFGARFGTVSYSDNAK